MRIIDDIDENFSSIVCLILYWYNVFFFTAKKKTRRIISWYSTKLAELTS